MNSSPQGEVPTLLVRGFRAIGGPRILPRRVIDAGVRIIVRARSLPPMKTKTHRWLTSYYAEHNRRLEHLLDRDLSCWA